MAMASSRLLDVRDLFIISCHDIQSGAKWSNGDDKGGCRCSECGSVHPEEFVRALKAREIRKGWSWGVKDQPIRAELEVGVFDAEHLKDMPVDWLYANALIIFEATGVLFYWERETLQFQPIRPRVRTVKGKVALTELEITNAMHLNRHHYVTR